MSSRKSTRASVIFRRRQTGGSSPTTSSAEQQEALNDLRRRRIMRPTAVAVLARAADPRLVGAPDPERVRLRSRRADVRVETTSIGSFSAMHISTTVLPSLKADKTREAISPSSVTPGGNCSSHWAHRRGTRAARARTVSLPIDAGSARPLIDADPQLEGISVLLRHIRVEPCRPDVDAPTFFTSSGVPRPLPPLNRATAVSERPIGDVDHVARRGTDDARRSNWPIAGTHCVSNPGLRALAAYRVRGRRVRRTRARRVL